jgi:hypothetical protein
MKRLCVTSTLLALVVLSGLPGCSHPIRTEQPEGRSPVKLDAFWTDATVRSRNLYWGAGNESDAPKVDGVYKLISKDTAGFSTTYDVKDDRGREWRVKVGAEAKPEVVASRLVWAMGYQQVPSYYVPRWTLDVGGAEGGAQPAGRFRPKTDQFKKSGDWSWHQNPFVGIRPYRGLLVMMAMLNNSDLKPDQNAVYELNPPIRGATLMYTVTDLGQTFGTTGILNAKRGDADAFDEHGFIKAVDPNHVEFVHHGRYGDLFRQITAEDVRWICARLGQLTPAQWADAFRAAAYHPTEAERFIRRMKQKIDQGLRGQADAELKAAKR